MEMTGSKHIVAVVGSHRRGSHTRTALEHALDAAREAGATTDIVAVDAFDLPVFDPDSPDAGDAPALRDRLRTADGIILGTPMYHGSYSGPLKNALDYCGFEEFEGKTVGLLAVAGGQFPTAALDHLRTVCRALNAWVLPQQAAVPSADARIADDRLQDEQLRERVTGLGTAVVEYAGVDSYPDRTAACAVPSAD